MSRASIVAVLLLAACKSSEAPAPAPVAVPPAPAPAAATPAPAPAPPPPPAQAPKVEGIYADLFVGPRTWVYKASYQDTSSKKRPPALTGQVTCQVTENPRTIPLGTLVTLTCTTPPGGEEVTHLAGTYLADDTGLWRVSLEHLPQSATDLIANNFIVPRVAGGPTPLKSDDPAFASEQIKPGAKGELCRHSVQSGATILESTVCFTPGIGISSAVFTTTDDEVEPGSKSQAGTLTLTIDIEATDKPRR